MSINILDLDKNNSIDEQFGVGHNSMLLPMIIQLIRSYGTHIRGNYYKLCVKYLGHPIPFVFDFGNRYVNANYYRDDLNKNDLNKSRRILYLSISDEAEIRYIENDHSGLLPEYFDQKICLKPAAYLMNLAHKLFSYIGFRRARLDDASNLVCFGKDGRPDSVIILWLYYILKKGRSWYSKFGYEPCNSGSIEYSLAIADLRKIRLDEVQLVLQKVLNSENGVSNLLLDKSKVLSELIADSEETLYEYTMNHSIEDFGNLTNNLESDIYSKPITSLVNDKVENVDFFWSKILTDMRLANVMQVNNDISRNCYRM